MKILPTQTLILANERAPTVVPRAASSGQALRSVTVVSAGPDAQMLYMRADYSQEAAPGGDAVPFFRDRQAPAGSAVATRAGGGGSGSTQNSLKVALYAQTQRPTGDALMWHVDVYA